MLTLCPTPSSSSSITMNAFRRAYTRGRKWLKDTKGKFKKKLGQDKTVITPVSAEDSVGGNVRNTSSYVEPLALKDQKIRFRGPSDISTISPLLEAHAESLRPTRETPTSERLPDVAKCE
jgi:hypothetical protein